MATRLLFVHAHPDDESLWTGGTIFRHLSRGGDADVIIATWAEGTRRHTEAIAAAQALGLPRPPIMLGYADEHVPDSAPGATPFCDERFDTLVRTVVGHIRHLRPDAIFTYDPLGIYGHPDHIQAHRVTVAATDAAAVPNLYRRLGAPWQVRSRYEVTPAAWLVDLLWDSEMAETFSDRLVGIADADIDLQVTTDKGAELAAKTAAIRSHVSEMNRSRSMKALMALPPDLRTTLLRTECFRRYDLVDGGCDLGLGVA